MSESFAELFEESLATINMATNSIVTGVVVDIDQDRVTVHAGLKSEGIIPKSQFFNEAGECDLSIGDSVSVIIEVVDDGWGETHMSREKARRAEVWEKLHHTFKINANIEGVINDKVRGGYTVDIENIRAFLPGSLVDVRPIREITDLEGSLLDFKIIKLDQKRNNVVVSRRAVLEAANSAELQTLLDSMHEGQELTGIVKNLTEYGAFVDLGGIDALLHITDMAWRRVHHPSEVVQLGEEIKAKVLRFDAERNRISLGLKQLGEDPWVGVAERYPVHKKLKGTVTNITEYGCFAELEEGVEGLVHVSEMAWRAKNLHPTNIVQVGEEIEVMVLSLEEGRRRISLGMKQCQANPWEHFANQHKAGTKIQGTINSITDFGIFIGLEGGIDGLVHLSDISWSEPGEVVVRNYSKGSAVEVVVLSVDPTRERVSLSMKHLEQDVFTDYLADKTKGSVVTGTIKKQTQWQAIIALAEGVEATMKVSEADSREHVDDLRTFFEEGQTIEAAISNIDRKKRTIRLSVKAKQLAEEVHTLATHHRSVQEQAVVGTIGDLIQEQLAVKRQTSAQEGAPEEIKEEAQEEETQDDSQAEDTK